MAERRSRRPRRGRRTRRSWSARALQLGLIALCLAAAYLLWLDFTIQQRFKGRRWTVPARVFAAPVELYAGQPLDADGVIRRLRRAGYREAGDVAAPGRFRRAGGGIEIHVRRFEYWDGAEPPRRIRVVTGSGAISRIVASDSGHELSVARIDPPVIGKIYPRHDEDRVLVPGGAIPPPLIDALVATEDRHFFTHAGVDLRGIGRALFVNLRSAAIVQGGSTLTQQLVKNYFLSHERTFVRKFNEILMALLLEARYSKEQILEAYINEVYLGQDGARAIHGFGTAAEFYFGRPLGELRTDQLAVLAGMVRGASFYNPRRHPRRALERRNLVLGLMQEQDLVSPGEAAALRQLPLDLAAKPRWSTSAYPHYLDAVRRQLLRDYEPADLRDRGLRIFTNLDVDLQDLMQEAADRTVRRLEGEHDIEAGSLQVAAVAVRISSGELLGMVGARGGGTGGFNRAVDARRPIGSLIKPFVYLSALADPARFNVMSALDDSPVAVPGPEGETWRPRNYDQRSHGAVTMIEALANSYNLATVRLGMSTGIDRVIETLGRAGLDRQIEPYPSLLLGAVGLAPLEVAQIYQTLANNGFRVPLSGIREVVDDAGAGLSRYGVEMQQALDPRPAYLAGYLLTRATRTGTARAVGRQLPQYMPLAGKTGTTDDVRDSWFAGYGNDLLVVVWIGRDDNRPMGLTGASGALPVWLEIISHTRIQALDMTPPDGIQWTPAVRIPWGDECLDLEGVPYMEGQPPAMTLECKEDSGWFW